MVSVQKCFGHFVPPLSLIRVKSTARLLNINCVNKGGLDLSKEVLWASVGQRAAVLQAVKVGGQKKILLISPVRAIPVRTGAIGRF